MKKKMAVATATILISIYAQALIIPISSEESVPDAQWKCQQQGTVVGLSNSTANAHVQTFFVTDCARPDLYGGTTYIPTWSIYSTADAENKCLSPSTSTGLPAGSAIGQSVEINAATSLVYLVACNIPDSAD
jgi:hypothetical protein